MSSRSNRIVLTNNTRIGNYKIIDLLGQGGYGDVYKVENILNGKIFALKTEYLNAQKKALEKEINFLKQLDSPYFPHIYAEGTDGNVFYCVMDLFGKSIANCKKLNKIDPPILMTMGIEMIKAIQAFHEAGFIHRDIKPSNFLLSGRPDTPIVLIDFGLSRKFIDPETGEPIPPSPKPHFGGTKKYVSIRLHQKKDSSKCDDLASWFYTMVECFQGKLPWGKEKDKEEVGEQKKTIQASELCNRMPSQFIDLYMYIFSLDYYDVPDYRRIINTLKAILATNYGNPTIDLTKVYPDTPKNTEPQMEGEEDELIINENPKESAEKNGCCLLY